MGSGNFVSRPRYKVLWTLKAPVCASGTQARFGLHLLSKKIAKNITAFPKHRGSALFLRYTFKFQTT
jgi:hypothetical protein